MKEKQLKQVVEEPQNVLEPEQTGNLNNNVAEEAIREEKEKLKLKFSAKVNVLVSDKELQEKLHELIAEVVDEAITLGCASEMAEKGMDFMTDSVKGLIERVANPTDAARASKYKQLYFNQRMIAAHLESALQFANAQVATYETGEEPFTSPLSKSLGNILGATALGMGSFCQSAKEKQLD